MLATLQAALARLCTDEELRRAFFGDPVGVGTARLGLSQEEARRCAALAEREVARFAESLGAKRRHEAGKQLSLVARVLGERFSALFAEYAGAHPRPESRVRYADCLGFCRWLIEGPPAGLTASVREIVRYEAVWLEVHQGEGERTRLPRIRVALFSVCLTPLLETEGARAISETGKGWTLAVWITSPSGVTRHRLLGRGRGRIK